MKVIATLQADLDDSPLGTRSRLAEPLAGVPVLRRTVERLSRAQSLSGIFVLCPVAQRQRCEALVAGTRAVVRPFDAPPPSWAPLVQTARKWSLDGWRGGLAGATYFDEFTDARLIHSLLEQEKADVVLSAPAAAVLLDPALADRMVRHFERHRDDIKLTFTQAPPGLAGILLDASVIRELAEAGTPVGWILSYKPDAPQKDLVFSPCCCEVPLDVRYAVGRLTADTDRSIRRVKALLQECEAPDLAAIGRWLRRDEATTAEPLPREVEIELTTDDPYPQTLLRPRGSRVQPRGPIEPSVVAAIVEELSGFDDSLVVLGGFGDPLRHPQFRSILESIRSGHPTGHPSEHPSGHPSRRIHAARHALFGLAVRTTAVDLTDEAIEVLVARQVDVLDVTLDAWTPELYERIQTPDNPGVTALDAVCANLDRLGERCRRQNTVRPIVTPQMTKARDNVHELDDFYDGWIRRLGVVTISGHSHYARQCEDRSVMKMAPSPRESCRRLRSRCLVLSDGRVTLCDQDFNGRHAVGCLGDDSLEQLWRGAEFERVRAAHRAGRFDPTPLCAVCDEWHRP